tara:strand:- start:1580 stop:1750 length:171 start_codon:yes stop_codon:yes gene_type:complete
MSIKQKIKFKTTPPDMKPMTREEEYRNADVPMPKQEEDPGDIKFLAHLKNFFKGEK